MKKSLVSIITITQYKRYNCLLILYELIKLQTYKNIVEWVLVEGSKEEQESNNNKKLIENLITQNNLNIKIRYIERTGKKLGELRNIGNNACIGDIIVCMDDDDYYPPQRVADAVFALSSSNCLIAGCSAILIYDYLLDKLYKFKQIAQYHSTNNAFAFKKEYLIKHKHADVLQTEEPSFTNEFTEPMIQLDSKKCIVVSSHNFNTFNKREICVSSTMGINPKCSEVNEPITNYIPIEFYNRYKKEFYVEEDSNYDIVYYTGGFLGKWDPKDKSLGGSEQAIVYLCENWVKKGLKVCVYCDIANNIVHNGVEYKFWTTFPFNHRFNTVILWRNIGFLCGIQFNIKAKKIYWDLHDNMINCEVDLYKKYNNLITKILFKSQFHHSEFEKYYNVKLTTDQFEIIPNGIVVDLFSNNWDNVERNPYRFCYVSYYTRGLQHIIPHIWAVIKSREPRAELHLYYGMEMFNDDLKKNLKILTSYPGVIDHGRQNREMIVREKYMSTFQLYITNTISEIDCISIRESLVSGCIPLISNSGVFKERDGIHFELMDTTNMTNEVVINLNNIALHIVDMMKKQEELYKTREYFKNSPTILDWNTIAEYILSIN